MTSNNYDNNHKSNLNTYIEVETSVILCLLWKKCEMK